MRETGEVTVGGLVGDKAYQERARLALPILVRQAKAGQTMYYGQLAEELEMSNPRTLNYPLGTIGNALLDLSHEWGKPVPPIQALVINKSTHLPGEGIAWFAPDAAEFKDAPRRERQRIVHRMLHDVFSFREWDAVLEALAGCGKNSRNYGCREWA